ncbi:MAG TPA: DEDD exonuclease domain-containing protein [Actinomycetota bacterium]|nr:DEDD exonuclease domain-containing protein [Actinomycetota bacterium]
MLAQLGQTTLEEGIPLEEATFCVVDLETTGGSPIDSRITEIGAVKVRGGERIGVFETLVDPEVPIPRRIAHLTGIDDLLVRGAPTIDAVLPSFAEFLHGCVFVAHNARFDFAFLNAALQRAAFDAIPSPPVCTARLARRVVWPDVPNVRLRTLAEYFRTAARPTHRALPDAETCAEVLSGLLRLGRRLGIATVGDLHLAVTARGRPNFGKIALTEGLPTGAGVYRFVARDGRILYVGKSKDLRRRVRSYFYGDPRKQVQDLLAETASVEAIGCSSELEALVLEARLIRRNEPPYNRRGKAWRRYAYLKIDPAEAYPRIKVVREARGGATFLGPFPSSEQARLAKEALEEAFPIRRCTRAMGRATRFPPCALADIGRCLAPCDGRAGPERYEGLVRALLSSLSAPGGLLGALRSRMTTLARQQRFEEAALARKRLRALAEAIARYRVDAWLLGSRSLALRDADGRELRIRGGALVRDGTETAIGSPCPRERADEVAALRSWVQRTGIRIVHAEPPPAEPVDGGAVLHRLLVRLRDPDRHPREDRSRPLDWGRWSERSSSRAPGRPSDGSSAA